MLALLVSGCSQKDVYPNRPITLICPWSAGGGTDLCSRQIAVLLERELQVPVNVINATGGAGVTGHTRGALARPDGYTLTTITVELNMLHWRGLTTIEHSDFAVLGSFNRDAAALFVRADAPWKTLAELTEFVRQNRGKLTASGTAHGGIWHVALAGWLKASGLEPTDAIWISINGAGPSLQELLAGGVQAVSCSLPEAKALLDAGRIRCLGVMADERLPAFSGVPTFREQGVAWSLGGWRGIAVPAKTPEPIVQKLAETLARIVHSDDFKRFMDQAGFNWTYEDAKTFRASLVKLDAQFGTLLTTEAFRSMAQKQVGPMFFPRLLGIAGAVVLAALLITGGLKTDAGAAAMNRAGFTRCAEVVAGIAIYILFAEIAGFVITGGVLLFYWMVRQQVRWPVAAGVSGALVPLLYHVFAVLLRVPLPRGWLGW